MISFKMILINFTILSVVIWVMPVTSDETNEIKEKKQKYCKGLVTYHTLFNGTEKDYETIKKTNDYLHKSAEVIIQSLLEISDLGPLTNYILVMSETLGILVMSETLGIFENLKMEDFNASNIIINIGSQYCETLKQHINQNKYVNTPIDEFCKTKIESDKDYLKNLVINSKDTTSSSNSRTSSPSRCNNKKTCTNDEGK